MSKLNLVIADIDEVYARGLSEYVNSYHLPTFTVSCFTKPAAFVSYIGLQPMVDVLLAGPEFYDLSAGYPNIKLRVMLSSNPMNEEYPGFQVINRFSTGEKLIGEVVHLYSRLNPQDAGFSPCLKEAALIGVYSASGGAGKTTIAAALAIQCRELGMKAFYLNLEAVNSTAMFFNTDSRRNISYIFYYIKEKSSSLSFRMEGVKSTDSDSGVDFFSPPESSLEYEELDPGELERLLQGIKAMNCYDYIFVDMSCAFDMKNHKIMSLCDRIVLVELPERVSYIKKETLMKELSKLDSGSTETVSGKLVGVVNRYRGKTADIPGASQEYGNVLARIPEYSRALLRESGRVAIDDEDFWKAVNQLLKLLSGK